MRDIPEAVRERAYDRWGHVCFICDAPPPPLTLGQKKQGKTEWRIPLHHLNGEKADDRVPNLLPVCESSEHGDACHDKIHSGGGRRLHRCFHQRLCGEISEIEMLRVMRLLAGE